MSHDGTDKLVMMANQIAKAFEAQGRERALPQIEEHIKLFWDPRMKAKIDAHIAAGGAGLIPLALEALAKGDLDGKPDDSRTAFPLDASSVDGGAA